MISRRPERHGRPQCQDLDFESEKEIPEIPSLDRRRVVPKEK